MIILNIWIITLIIVFITDTTDFWESIKQLLWKFTYSNNKPYKPYTIHILDCSQCQTWWIGLIYILCTGNFTIPYIGLCALMAFLTPIWKDLLYLIKDILTKTLNIINNILNK